MNKRTIAAITLLLGASVAFAGTEKSASKPQDAAHKQALRDIQKTLGSVPSFFKQFPPEALPGAWLEMKNLQLSTNTRIPPRYKELIGLGVAAQIPCRYCTYFHKEANKVSGGNAREQQEAIALAGLAYHWSTFLTGLNLEEAQYKKEFDQIFEHLKARQQQLGGETAAPAETPSEQATDTTSAEWAYQDIEKEIGFVPTFMRAFPRRSAAGAWKAWKALNSSAIETQIPAKYRDLVRLGVSSQIPCKFCVYYDTQSAKMNGATDQEIQEAIAMAANTRLWSTVLNGYNPSESAFRKEADQIMRHFKTQQKKAPQQQLGGETAPEGENVEGFAE